MHLHQVKGVVCAGWGWSWPAPNIGRPALLCAFWMPHAVTCNKLARANTVLTPAAKKRTTDPLRQNVLPAERLCSTECFHAVPDFNRKLIYSFGVLMKHFKIALHHVIIHELPQISPGIKLRDWKDLLFTAATGAPDGCSWQIMVGFDRWKWESHSQTWSFNQFSFEQHAKWLKQVLLCTQSHLYINSCLGFQD